MGRVVDNCTGSGFQFLQTAIAYIELIVITILRETAVAEYLWDSLTDDMERFGSTTSRNVFILEKTS